MVRFGSRALRAALVIGAPLLASSGSMAGAALDDLLHHDLAVRLDPEAHRLQVTDEVRLPDALPTAEVHFVLHAGLDPVSLTPGVTVTPLAEEPRPSHLGINTSSFTFPEEPPLTAYALTFAEEAASRDRVTLRYAGTIHHPLEAGGEEYARSFRETPGTIAGEGVFLAGSSYWYPWFGREMVTFRLEVRVPDGWDAVSQGRRVQRGSVDTSGRGPERIVVWDSPEPMDEIYLVAGAYTLHEDKAGEVATYVYLRDDDETLARKYLETTAQYLEMYGKLLGPYPYAKFALVENFWETGYGMPSFTLLGPRVIRFPFILHSSYPHEILHNWWGNGVFVDYETGNWCEGLTAYLADHLVKEQRGQGAEYRRDLLRKYADYVREGKDFPLTAFRSRHSSATEAVGYGKTAMLFHMLRRRLGEDMFVEGMRALYRDQGFRRASFDDVRRAFEQVSGQELEPFFRAWVERTGAPSLRIDAVEVRGRLTTRSYSSIDKETGEVTREFEEPEHIYSLDLALSQDQPDKPFPLQVPVAVTLEGEGEARLFTVEMSQRTVEVVLGEGDHGPAIDRRPVRVQVDPEFDLFRRLHRSEIPPSLAGAFGAPRVLILLPAAAPAARLAAYRALAAQWSGSGAGEVQVATDVETAALPADRAVWVLGWENRFRPAVEQALAPYDADLTNTSLRVEQRTLVREEHAAVAAVTHPGNADLVAVFAAADDPAAVPGLARKLPHYGKYGYLGFEGDAPDNVLKGIWPAVGSPLDVIVAQPDGSQVDQPAAARPAREALASLPPAFSGQNLRGHVAFLAADALEGRGCGSPGLGRAAAYIEERFREYGLAPGADDGSYRQVWTDICGAEETPAEMVNLAGILPGTRGGDDDSSVVLVAHYDHLGRGWPDAHAGDEGQIHNGADDNASGVAVLLELARVLAGAGASGRTVVFLAVAGEECGLRGAHRYVKEATRFPASRAIGVLNIDTVGRLENRKLLVLGAGSAREWVHIVRGAGYVTGLAAEAVMDDPGASDQAAFLAAGIPAVQFFSGPHLDYHRPTDDPEKLDYGGMVEVATFIREFVAYLAEREEPLTSQGSSGGASGAPPSPGTRRVSLGTIPDFAYPGPGYRLSGVTPGSPAEAAGLREGDVIVRIGERSIEGLRDLSETLKEHAPGDRITVVFQRDGAEQRAETTLTTR